MRIVTTFILVLALGACAPATPSSDPGQILHVVNNSDRAVMADDGQPARRPPDLGRRAMRR